MDDRVDEFGQLFAEFVRRALENESTKEPPFRALIRDHLDADPTAIPVVAFDVADWDHANLQFALEALLAKRGREAELVGVGGGQKRYMALSLSDLINATHFEPGPVEYDSLDVGPNTTHRCILFGLVFLRAPEGRAVLFVRRGDQQGGPSPGLMVEVLATDAEYASALLDELRALMREHNVFRGQMISLESTMWGQVKVVFHERPTTRRDEVILPEAVLVAIERQTLGIARRADALRAAGRHLKRGVLLHGPPGTGKSQTIVNMVADAIGRQRSLLVVCQKQAALEVVHKRLVAEGLGGRVIMIAVLIEQQVRETLNWPFAAALSAVLLAATFAVYALAQRFTRPELQS